MEEKVTLETTSSLGTAICPGEYVNVACEKYCVCGIFESYDGEYVKVTATDTGIVYTIPFESIIVINICEKPNRRKITLG